MSKHQHPGKSILLTGRSDHRFGEDAEARSSAPRVQKPTAARATETALMKPWTHLWPREFVELRRGPEVRGTGRVDEVTLDGNIIWIHLSGGWGRVMIHESDGIDIWRTDPRIRQNRGNS